MKKNWLGALLGALWILTIATGCSTGDAQEGGDNTGSLDAAALGYEYTSEDLDDSWDEDTAVPILLTGTGIQAEGAGVTVSGTTATIQAAGTYVLSGTLADGQIVVDAGPDDLVRLVLSGVTISNTTSAAIYSKQAAKTVIILAEGSENTVTDGESYTYAEGEDEPDAAIFAKDDLSFTGKGSLQVTGNDYNAIGSKDNLCITAGQFTLTAANDGLRGRDAIAVLDGSFRISAGNDGLKANNDTDTEKGFIVLDGGSFIITAAHDGVQAETSLTVTGGSFDIYTGGGASSAPQSEAQFHSWGAVTAQAETESESLKGLKAGTLLAITGGSFLLDTEDDALHSNGDMSIAGGSVQIAAGDDGLHADNAMVIDAGSIQITQSYEGIEGTTVDINSGQLSIVSRDDGINAAGGSDGVTQGPMGQDRFGADSNAYIRVTGGAIAVNAEGDGVDSNGALYFDGGVVTIDGPVSSGNSAFDADGGITMGGGTLVALGSSEMMTLPVETSTQPCFVIYYTETQQAGTAVSLQDSAATVVAAHSAAKTYQAAIISVPGLVIGETYALYSGSEKLGELDLAQTVTQVSSDGSEASGMMNNPGGGRQGATGTDGAGGDRVKPEVGQSDGYVEGTPPERSFGDQTGDGTPPDLRQGGGMEGGIAPEDSSGQDIGAESAPTAPTGTV